MGRRREPTQEEMLAEQRALVKDALDTGKTELDLRTESIDIVREACAIKTLKKLELKLGSLTELPKEIGLLTGLESLRIENNKLKSLPDEIGALVKLDTFVAYHNELTTLPESFGELVNLRKLTLWHNNLKSLPKSLGRLKNLTEIELKWNKLGALPDSFGQLASLEEADIKSNELASLPGDLSGLVKLHRLQLGKNKLKRFPSGLLTLPAVVELDLSENELDALPEDIDRLKTLRELRVDDNEITKLPKKLFSLPLRALKVENNKLTEIPKELASIPSLVMLVVYDNPIEGIEEETLRLSKNDLFAKLGLWKPRTISDAVPPQKDAILTKYKARFETFVRESKRRGGEKVPVLLAYMKGEGNVVPPSDLSDTEELGGIVDVLSPYSEWTFVDRRILAFITQDAWRYKNPGYDYFRGYDDRLYRWLKEQVEQEPEGSTLFRDVATEILPYGIAEETLLQGALEELHEVVLRGDGTPTSFGNYLIARAPKLEDFFLAQKYARREALVGLLLRHARDTFMRIGDRLLSIGPDSDGDIHVPYDALDQACAVEPARFEALILSALEQTNCDGCRGDTARVLAKHYPKHRDKALAIAKRTLAIITDRKNKEERYNYPFSLGERWGDGAGAFIGWALQTFGADIHADVQTFVEETKVFDIDVAEVVAKALGQKSVDMLAEGLKMSFDDDDIAPHFRRMFAMLAPLDWSKYHDLAWELARSEHRQVRETACLALGKLDPKIVVPKAKELLEAKKGHEREAGVLILSLVGDSESKKTLEGLLSTEKSDDARDIIVNAFFGPETKCDRDEADERVRSASERGKLDRPVAKWLDEKKLPKLHWAKGKGTLDADTVRFLFHRQTRQVEIAVDPEARGVLALVDRERGGEFAAKVLALVLKNGGVAAKNRFALTLVGMLGDDSVIEPLEEIAIEGKNENAVRTLGLIGSMAAARALDRIIKVFRTKYPNVREPAQEAFQSIAEGLGMTPFELADSMIPDFGFEKGKLLIAGTKPKLFALISPEQKIVLADETGKMVKAPKTLAAKPKAAIKDLEVRLKESARQLRTSLEYYLIVRRRWEPRAWAKFFDGNALAASFAMGFVWGAYAGDKPKTMFRVTADGERVGIDGKVIKVEGDSIGLVHPLEIDPSLRAKWLAALTSAGIKPAFAQLDRPTFALNEDEKTRAKCFRFEEKELSGLTFKGRAERLGWRRGSVIDSGEVSAYRKLFPHDKIEVFIATSGLGVTSSYEDDSEVTLKDLFFVRPGAIVTGSYTYDEPRDESDERLVKLADVPPIVFSEAVADLTAITRTKEDAEA
jgi:hypothetical protein